MKFARLGENVFLRQAELTGEEFRLYSLIMFHSWRTGFCEHSLKDLCAMYSLNYDSHSRLFKRLRIKNWVEKSGGKIRPLVGLKTDETSVGGGSETDDSSVTQSPTDKKSVAQIGTDKTSVGESKTDEKSVNRDGAELTNRQSETDEKSVATDETSVFTDEKSVESPALIDRDLKREESFRSGEMEEGQGREVFGRRNGLRTEVPPEESEYVDTILDGLRQRFNTPFVLSREPEWVRVAENAFRNGFTSEHVLEVFDTLEKIKKRQKKNWRMKPEILEDNIPHLEALRNELRDLENGYGHGNGKFDRASPAAIPGAAGYRPERRMFRPPEAAE